MMRHLHSPQTTSLVQQLVDSMERSGRALRDLHSAMESNRTAWLAVRPEHLESAVNRMDGLAATVRQEETLRDTVLRRLAELLDLKGTVNVSRLTERLPAASAQLLERAGRKLSATAKAIGAEGRFGERLLRSSQQIHDGLLRGAATEDQDRANAYDRTAHKAAAEVRGGTLVNGMV